MLGQKSLSILIPSIISDSDLTAEVEVNIISLLPDMAKRLEVLINLDLGSQTQQHPFFQIEDILVLVEEFILLER